MPVHDIDGLFIGNPMLAQDLLQVCDGGRRISQGEPLAMMIAIMVETLRHEGNGRVAFEQRPDQIKVIYAGIISNALVQATSIENGLPAKKQKMSEIARLLFQCVPIALNSWSDGRQHARSLMKPSGK